MSSNLGNYRVSLKFSEKDDDQVEVVKLLKQMGRRKSQFITKAIKYYLENEPTAEIPMPKNQQKNINKDDLKSLLIEVLTELNIDTSKVDLIEPKLTQPSSNKTIVEIDTDSKKEDNSSSDEILGYNDEDIDDFLDGLDNFT